MRGIGIDVCKPHLDVCLTGERSHHRFRNSEAGIMKLLQLIGRQEGARVLVEATGGYEQLVLNRLVEAGIQAMQVNPGRARDFARGLGLLVKTDRVDAQALAEMAVALGSRFRLYQQKLPWQEELGHYVVRHTQVKTMLTQTRQQLPHYREPDLLRVAAETVRALEEELKLIERAIRKLSAPHVTPALKKTKGVGPKLTAALLSLLPELGSISNKAISSLVGVAPFNHDSGGKTGARHIFGGRTLLRHILYMGALSAKTHDPELRTFYERLESAGKPFKVRMVAVMRKMLVRLNARRRDELKAALESAATLQPA
jgi:transposase